jgi:hypothetical protein
MFSPGLKARFSYSLRSACSVVLRRAVAVDACHSDGVPDLLDSLLLGKRELHLGRDCSNKGIQRPSIFVVVDVVILNCFPHVPHLEPYPHQRVPLDVVGLGECRPPTADTDVPDNGMNPMVTMVPVWGGKATPPIKTVISVDPAAGTSMPVWVVATVGGTDTAHAPPGAPPTHPRPFGLPPSCPWGCTTAHCTTCSRAASLASLSSSSVPPLAETELLVLLPRRASSSAAAARAAFITDAASSGIASLVTLTAIAAVSAALARVPLPR